jgi:hypothetical protein
MKANISEEKQLDSEEKSMMMALFLLANSKMGSQFLILFLNIY